MVVAEIKLYELLKARIGEKEAEAFVEILETKVDRKFEEKSQVYKDDIKGLSEHIDKVFATKEDLAKLQTQIEAKFNDQLKWMIVMWITQLAAIAGIIKMFMK